MNGIMLSRDLAHRPPIPRFAAALLYNLCYRCHRDKRNFSRYSTTSLRHQRGKTVRTAHSKSSILNSQFYQIILDAY